MPSYVIAEPMSASSSLLIEKFLVSLPVLTSLVIGLFYVIYQVLELEEDLLLDLNSGQDTGEVEEQPRTDPVGGAAAEEGGQAEVGAEEAGGGGGGGGGSGEELDPQEEGVLEELVRKFVVLCMLLEEALFSHANEHSGTEPIAKEKKNEKDPKTKTAAAKGPKRSVSANERQKTDQLSGKVASPVGKFNRPHLVTSVEENGVVVVVSDDVTAIPVQVVPSSVEVTVAPADQVGENSCGCYAAAAAANRCVNAAQRCRSKSCQRRGGLSQAPLGDDAAPPEADRVPVTRNSSSLGFCRQTSDDVEALIGRIRRLLSQHQNTERQEDDDHVCVDCDAFPTTVERQECRRHRSHLCCCCNHDVRDGSCELKPGQGICVVVKLDHKNLDTVQCKVDARATPQRQSTTANNTNLSSRVLVETANLPKTSPTRCGCSHLPHASRTSAPRV